jgi:hypothetical protein
MKIVIYHHKRAEEGHAMQLQLSDLTVVLMPRLRLLTQLDPDGLYEFNVPQMLALIIPHAEEYRRVVSGTSYLRTWMSRALSRSISISNCSKPPSVNLDVLILSNFHKILILSNFLLIFV